MKWRIPVVWAAIIVATVVVLGVCAYLWVTQPTVRAMVPLVWRCEPVQQPELHPSGGLAWSKEHYPEQYSESNYNIVAMVALNDRANERFIDAAGRTYSREFVSSFSYTDAQDAPKVRLEYLKMGEAFAGRIVARGLKPNFAYQMKLHGVFADIESFERIGHVGRWRMPGYATNYSDEDYELYPNKSEVESYLALDFFVTDAKGNTEKEFYTDSTLHVLFNSTWQRRPAPEDGRPVMVTLRVPDGALYANPAAGTVVQAIYAQSEQHGQGRDNRPAIGEAFLPAGHYTGELVLTEESFHSFGDGGWWATVMKAPVEFEIVDRPKWRAQWVGGEKVMGLSLADAVTSDIQVASHDASGVRGMAVSQKPSIDFAETLDLPGGDRYFLRAEVACGQTHAWEVWFDTGSGFEAGECYAARSSKCRGWRQFDIEITSTVAGRKARLRIRPAVSRVDLGVRNVGIYRIPREEQALPSSASE